MNRPTFKTFLILALHVRVEHDGDLAAHFSKVVNNFFRLREIPLALARGCAFVSAAISLFELRVSIVSWGTIATLSVSTAFLGATEGSRIVFYDNAEFVLRK